jgi:hypothetical protein
MPLLHCKDCHHEWEGNKSSRCDWCGGKSYILQEESSFEKFVKYDMQRIIDAWKLIGEDFKDQLAIEKAYIKMIRGDDHEE